MIEEGSFVGNRGVEESTMAGWKESGRSKVLANNRTLSYPIVELQK